MGMRGKGRLPEKRLIFFQAVVSSRLEVNGTAELLPTGLFSCRNNSKAPQRLKMMTSVMDPASCKAKLVLFCF